MAVAKLARFGYLRPPPQLCTSSACAGLLAIAALAFLLAQFHASACQHQPGAPHAGGAHQPDAEHHLRLERRLRVDQHQRQRLQHHHRHHCHRRKHQLGLGAGASGHEVRARTRVHTRAGRLPVPHGPRSPQRSQAALSHNLSHNASFIICTQQRLVLQRMRGRAPRPRSHAFARAPPLLASQRRIRCRSQSARPRPVCGVAQQFRRVSRQLCRRREWPRVRRRVVRRRPAVGRAVRAHVRRLDCGHVGDG